MALGRLSANCHDGAQRSRHSGRESSPRSVATRVTRQQLQGKAIFTAVTSEQPLRRPWRDDYPLASPRVVRSHGRHASAPSTGDGMTRVTTGEPRSPPLVTRLSTTEPRSAPLVTHVSTAEPRSVLCNTRMLPERPRVRARNHTCRSADGRLLRQELRHPNGPASRSRHTSLAGGCLPVAGLLPLIISVSWRPVAWIQLSPRPTREHFRVNRCAGSNVTWARRGAVWRTLTHRSENAKKNNSGEEGNNSRVRILEHR